MAFASEEIIEVLNRIKPPYNIGQPAQEIAIEALNNVEQINEWIKITVQERANLAKALAGITIVKKVFASDANFLLVKVEDPDLLYHYLVKNGIIVRDRSKVILCECCLRITVGTPEENAFLVEAMKKY